jgi:hypothetical protein
MKKQIALMALSVVVFGCSSDSTSPSSVNPDVAACDKGSISVGDVKTGVINSASCVRYDFAYAEDSVPFDNYSFKAEKGKGYMFMLENATLPSEWDALLELVTVNPSTGEEQLLALSDDEGNNGYSRLYFIAPVSGTFFLRAGGYALFDTSSYKLTARSCDSPIPQITDTLAASTQTLSATDCVLARPNFVDDSSHVKLFSLLIGPNETKTVTVTSSDFNPGFQIYGPAWGVSCDYAYEGCGGGPAQVSDGNSASFTITAGGAENCEFNVCEFSDFPGQYTVAVGSTFASTGSFTIAVSEGAPPAESIVGGGARSMTPTLNFLKRKPLRATEYLNRTH